LVNFVNAFCHKKVNAQIMRATKQTGQKKNALTNGLPINVTIRVETGNVTRIKLKTTAQRLAVNAK
jgi:hypothetical protein